MKRKATQNLSAKLKGRTYARRCLAMAIALGLMIVPGYATNTAFAEDYVGDGSAVTITSDSNSATYNYAVTVTNDDDTTTTTLESASVTYYNVYGEKLDSGDSTDNSVTISSGTIGIQYDEVDYDADTDTTTVLTEAGDTGYVYGGYTTSGNASNNTVTLSGEAKIGRHVYGGYTTSGNATSNSVTVTDSVQAGIYSAASSGGSYTGHLYGGYSETGAATSNSVTISSDSVTIDGSAYGGFGNSEVTNNTVTMTGGEITGEIYGGYTESGSAVTSNSVTLSGSATTGHITGGHSSNDAAVTYNTVTMSGSSFAYIVYGGLSTSGKADSNTVTISSDSDTTVSAGQIYGGSGYTSASSNTVNISTTTIDYSTDSSSSSAAIYGGYATSGDADSNTVTITDANFDGWYIAGGYGLSSADENKLTIDSSTIEAYYAIGGWSSTDTADQNEVAITNSSAISGSVYGGLSYGSSASENKVTVTSSTIEDGYASGNVYGGYVYNYSSDAASSSNEIALSSSTISGSVYGGYAYSYSATATAGSNSISISGGSISGDVYGGYAAGGSSSTLSTTANSVSLAGGTTITGTVYGGSSSTITGNTLTVADTDNYAADIENFETITFDISNRSDGETMLYLTTESEVDLTGATSIGVAEDNAEVAAKPGATLTLIDTTAGITVLSSSLTLETTEDYLLDSEYDSDNGTDFIEGDAYLDGTYTRSITVTDDSGTEVEETTDDSGNTVLSGYNLVLTMGDTVTVTSVGLDVTESDELTWGDSTRITLDSDVKYAFSSETEISGLDSEITISGDEITGTLLAVDDATLLMDGSSSTVSDLDDTDISSLTTTYTYEPADGVSVSGGAKVIATTEGSGDSSDSLALSITSTDEIVFTDILYSDDAPVTLNSEKTYDLSETTIDVSALTLVDSSGSEVEIDYDDDEVDEGGTIVMTLIDANGVESGLSENDDIPADTSMTFGYELTSASSDSELEGTLTGIVDIGDDENSLVLKTGTEVAVASVDLDLSDLVWDGDALLTLNSKLSYDFTDISSDSFTLSDAAITTDTFLDVNDATALIDGESSTVTNMSNLAGYESSYSYSLLDGLVNVTGTGVTTLTSQTINYSVSSIDTMDFYISEDTSTTEAMLTVDTADLSGTAVTVYAEPGDYLTEGYKVTLLDAEGGLTTDDSTTYTHSKVYEGVSVEQDLDVYREDDTIVASIPETEDSDDSDDSSGSSSSSRTLRSETKSLVETRVAQVAMIDQGMDLLSQTLSLALPYEESLIAWTPFVIAKVSDYRFETGSHIDINGFNGAIGFVRSNEHKDGRLSYGAAFQYGNGSYDSYCHGVHGEGDTEYAGGSIFAKNLWKDGFYLEGILSAGRTEGDYSSNTLLDGVHSSYDDDSDYFAAQLTIGKEIYLDEDEKLDIYGKYFYSSIDSSDTRLNTGEKYKFDEVDSSRIRLGTLFTKKMNTRGNYYVGLAYEYQFDASASATYNGMETLSPDLKGSSGMLEAGVQLMPKDSNMTIDLGVTGWAGTKRGIDGRLRLTWNF